MKKIFLILTLLMFASSSAFATGWKKDKDDDDDDKGGQHTHNHNHHNDINVNVDSPVVNVGSPRVTVGSPNVRVDSPIINVAAPRVQVDPRVNVDGLATLDQNQIQDQYIDNSGNSHNDIDIEGDTNANTNYNNNNASIDSGAVVNSNSYTSSFNAYDRIQHTRPEFGQNCVGTACKATSSIFITGSHDEFTGNSVNVGIAIPIGGGGRTASRAMKLEAQKMADRNRQDRERHQAEMAFMCMKLHELTRIAESDNPNDDVSGELWARCATFIPHHNHIQTGRANKHRDYTRRQVSPHSGAKH